jgi:hypothetical protein
LRHCLPERTNLQRRLMRVHGRAESLQRRLREHRDRSQQLWGVRQRLYRSEWRLLHLRALLPGSLSLWNILVRYLLRPE